MNTPIGIPSGWEEIAAWVASLHAQNWPEDIADDISDRAPRGATLYVSSKHDWREEPSE